MNVMVMKTYASSQDLSFPVFVGFLMLSGVSEYLSAFIVIPGAMNQQQFLLITIHRTLAFTTKYAFLKFCGLNVAYLLLQKLLFGLREKAECPEYHKGK